MNRVFWDLLDRGVLVYLDDILIYSRTEEEHRQLLMEVFDRLRKFKLFVKASKCNLYVESVSFLGYIVSSDGLRVDPTKISTVTSWPTPRTVKDV